MSDLPDLDVGDLIGAHVVLERLRSDHVDAVAAAADGDRSTFGWTQVPAGADSAREYITTLLDQTALGVAAPFVQRRVGDDVIVGCTRFMNPAWPLGRRAPDEVEIGGTWLASSAQRSAINSEAKLLLLTHAFDTWSVQRVALCTDARNSRSREAIARLGAGFEGVLRHHRPSLLTGEEGQLRDSALYSIVQPEWPTVRERLVASIERYRTR